MKKLIIRYLLSLTCVISFLNLKTIASEPDISFQIKLAGWAATGSNTYKTGKPISIRCVFKNTSDQPRTLFLKDHCDYHGTMVYPAWMAARVVDSAGTVITDNYIDKSDWWSSHSLASEWMRPMPGDTITLSPGAEVVRIIPLDAVIAGLETTREGLPQGTYEVQLNQSGLLSNVLEITIADD